MNRVLAKSFVVTIALTPACTRNEATTTANPPIPTVSNTGNPGLVVPTATATATPTPTAANTKKRKRTSQAPPTWHPADKVPSDLAPVQPEDANGHTVYVASDDRCYYEEPMKPPFPPMPTGARFVNTMFVDCPAAADDPAWDTCSSSTLMRSASTHACFCMPLGGNPPPPPLKNACPK